LQAVALLSQTGSASNQTRALSDNPDTPRVF
jgi:hypothetical protein